MLGSALAGGGTSPGTLDVVGACLWPSPRPSWILRVCGKPAGHVLRSSKGDREWRVIPLFFAAVTEVHLPLFTSTYFKL